MASEAKLYRAHTGSYAIAVLNEQLDDSGAKRRHVRLKARALNHDAGERHASGTVWRADASNMLPIEHPFAE